MNPSFVHTNCSCPLCVPTKYGTVLSFTCSLCGYTGQAMQHQCGRKWAKAPLPAAHPVFQNPRISAKDRNMIKGALRRAFARSELREGVMLAARVEHSDPDRPKCKKWIRCGSCKEIRPEWSSVVDHVVPVVALDSSFEQMGVDATVSSMWCDPSNLQAICKGCHDDKSTAERIAREDYDISMGWRAPRKPPKPKKPATKKARKKSK